MKKVYIYIAALVGLLSIISCTQREEPAVALWLPNMVFALIAVFLYRIAPK